MTRKARWHEKGAALRPPESRAYTPAPPIAVGSPRCSPSLCTCCKAPRSLAVRLLGAFHWRKGRPDSYCSSCTSARCRCLSRGHTWACRLLPKSSFDVLGEAMRARLRRVRYRLTPPARPQTCKDCWTRDGVDFHVSESVWRQRADPVGLFYLRRQLTATDLAFLSVVVSFVGSFALQSGPADDAAMITLAAFILVRAIPRPAALPTQCACRHIPPRRHSL